MIKYIYLLSIGFILCGCGSDIVRNISDAETECDKLLLYAKKRFSKYSIATITQDNIDEKCKLMLMASDSYSDETMSICRFIILFHALFWADNKRNSIGWSIENVKRFIDYRIAMIEYDYADDILSSACCVAKNTLIDLNDGRQSYGHLINLDDNSFKICIKQLESALLERILNDRIIAQQGDAPEPDSRRSCLSETISRPGDL